jgi:hypothetical protein
MRPTKIGNLILTAAACAAVAYLISRLVYSSLPPLPWTAVPALLLLAVAEGWSGRSLRMRLRGGNQAVEPVAVMAVARMAVLAKASSMAAAVLGGLAAGFVIYVGESLGKSAYRQDAYVGGATFASAVILAVAALYLENSCRVPASGDGGEQGTGGHGSASR